MNNLGVSLSGSNVEILGSIVERLVQLMQIRCAGIYIYDSSNDELRLLVNHNSADNQFIPSKVVRLIGSFIGQVITSSSEKLATKDYLSWSIEQSIQQGEAFGSIVGIRLQNNHQAIGVLFIDDKIGREYSEHDIDLLRIFRDYCSLVLKAAIEDQRDNTLTKLLNANHRIMSDFVSIPLQKRLQWIVDYAADITNAETSGILLVKGKDRLVLEAGFPLGNDLPRHIEIIAGEKTGLTGYVATMGQVFNSHGDHLKNHPAVRGERSHTPSGECFSLLMVPLKRKSAGVNEDIVVGWLRVDNKKDSHGNATPDTSFSRGDENVLLQFADTVVAAIETAEKLKELDNLFTNAPNAIIAFDNFGKITKVNAKAEEITRYTKESLIGMDMEKIYFDKAEAQRIDRKLREHHGHLNNYRTSIRTASGEKLPISLAVSNLYDAYDQRIGSVGYFEDLREHVERENLLRTLIDTARVYIYAKDLSHRFIIANQETAIKMGIHDPEKLVGMTDFDFYDRVIAERYNKDEVEILRSGEAITVEEETTDLSTGQRRWLITTKTPLRDVNERIIGIVGVGQDITNFKKRQKQIETLFGASDLILSEKDADQILETLVVQVLEVEKAKAVKLVLIDDDGATHDLVASGDYLLSDESNPIRSDGISMRVKREGRPVIIPDVSTSSLSLNPDMLVNGVKTAVCLPIIVNNKTIGVFWIHYSDTRHISDEDFRMIHLYVNQAAIVFTNAQQREELRLADRTAAIVTTNIEDQRSVLQFIADNTLEALNSDAVTLYLYDPIRETIEHVPITAGVKYTDKVSRFGHIPTNSVVRSVFNSEKPIVAPRVEVDPLLGATRFAKEENIKSCIALPLHFENRKLGVMFINYRADRQHFLRSEIENITLFSQRAAAAIYNSQLLKREQELRRDIEKQRNVLEELQSSVQTIIGGASLPVILENIAHQFIRFLEYINSINHDTCVGYVGLVTDGSTLRFLASSPSDVLGRINEAGRSEMDIRAENRPRGISVRAIRDRKLQTVRNVELDPDYIQVIEASKAQLSIPLTFGDEIIGVITLESFASNAFSTLSIEDENYLQILARQAALAVERMRRIEQSETAFKIIAGISDLKSFENTSQASTLNEIAKATLQMVNCDVVTLYMFDQISGQELRLGAIVGAHYPDRVRLSEYLEDPSLVAQILTGTSPIQIVNDTKSNDLYKHSRFIREERIRSFAGMRLDANGVPVGVLFASYRVIHDFKNVELSDLRIFAIQAAVAIQNIQLLAKERHFRQQAEKLNEVSVAINSAAGLTGLKAIAGLILDSLGELVPYHKATMQLVRGDRRELLATRGIDEEGISEKLLRPISQDKLVREVLATRSIIVIPNPKNHPDWEVYPETRDVNSWIGIPLVYQGDNTVVGFLTLDHRIPEFYREQSTQLIEIINSFARQAAIAIQKTSLFTAFQNQNDNLKLLNNATLELSTIRNIEDIPIEVYRITQKLMDTSNFFLCLFNERTQKLDYKLWYHKGKELSVESEEPTGLSGYVFKSGEPLLIRDYDAEQELIPTKAIIRTEKQLSWLGVPIFSPYSHTEKRVIGVISTQSPATNAFNESHQYLLQIMAIQTAIVVENARLIEEIKNAKQTQVKALGIIANTIASSASEKEFFGRILQWTESLMRGAEFVEIRLFDEVSQGLESVAYSQIVTEAFVRTPISIGITGWVARNKKPRLENDTGVLGDEYLPFVSGMSSELAIPILGNDQRLIGVLNIEHAERNAFSQDDVELAQALADLAGAAIENNRLNRSLKDAQVTIAEKERELVLSSVAFDLVHRINNLAGPIIPWISLTKRVLREKGALDNTVLHYLTRVEEDTRRILQEPRRLRDPLAGPKPIKLDELVGDIIAQTEIMSPEVEFTYFPEPDLPSIMAVERQLSIAIYNVMHNALKAVSTKQDGKVEVKLQSGGFADNPGIELKISDNGIGIAAENRANMFEYGFTLWSDGTGTGYGLWRTQNIVASLGGYVGIEDSPFGEGITLRLFLPLHKQN